MQCIFLSKNRKSFCFNGIKSNEDFSKYSLYTCMSAKLPMSTRLVTQLSSTVKQIHDRLAEKRSFCHLCLLYRILVRHTARLKVSTIVHPQYRATYKVDPPWCFLTWTKKCNKTPIVIFIYLSYFSHVSLFIIPHCHVFMTLKFQSSLHPKYKTCIQPYRRGFVLAQGRYLVKVPTLFRMEK